MNIQLQPIGRYETGIFDEGAAEISAYDPISNRLFVVNGFSQAIDVLDLSDPQNPAKLFEIDITALGASPNSVAIKNGIVAVAIEADPATEPGTVAFFDPDGNLLNSVTVGSLPDMLAFTPDGKTVLVANEGEPGDTTDPEGSVSIIDLSGGVENATVTTADFSAFNGKEDQLRRRGIRIFPDKMASEDFEPEYIAVSEDGKTAFVTLQENNAVAVLDLKQGKIKDIQPLGFKDWSQSSQLDASDQDGGINLKNYPLLGLYQPDAIATFSAKGKTYYITANEGDTRDENARVADLTLDPTAFPNAAELQLPENLGRLNVSTIDGDVDGDGDYDKLYTYGGRSFSIWDSRGKQVFDSGDAIARITADLTPELFNANNSDPAEFDKRSDDKGAEPEGVTIGVVGGKTLAFIGLERAGGGVLVYDVSNPHQPEFIQYARFDGDIAPEGLTFVSAEESSSGKPLLVVTNEVSGTTTIYEVEVPPTTGTSGDDILEGTADADVIDGGDGNDRIRGERGNDSLFGGSGNDKISGQEGDDTLLGGFGNDTLYGEAGDDVIDGGDGNDFILAWKGNDTVSGGDGSDTFVFAPSHGTDIIADFVVGEDFIGLKQGLTFADLSVATDGTKTEIALGGNTLAILNGVTDVLTEADFVAIV